MRGSHRTCGGAQVQSPPMRDLDSELLNLIRRQDGLVNTVQAGRFGLRRRDLQRRVDRHGWQWITQNVVATQLTPLSRNGALFAAALHFQGCGLGGSSALELLGLPQPHDGLIHVIGSPAGRIAPMPKVVLHTSTTPMLFEGGPPRVNPLDGVVQALRWGCSDRQAVFHAIWAIQRGLVELETLQTEMRRMKKSPGSAAARRRLRLIDPGVHSMPEFDFAKECSVRGLPQPRRQRRRSDSAGRTRYTDVEFELLGRTLIVEIDGVGHLTAEVSIDDQWRANEFLLQGAPVLRVPALALRLDPDPFFEQLKRALTMLLE